MFGLQKRQIESRSLEVFLFAIVLAYHTKKKQIISVEAGIIISTRKKISVRSTD